VLGSGAPRGRSKGTELFVWTIVILLLVALALGSWIGSYYVFGHPENPVSYALLTRMRKLDPPKKFDLTAAPRGEFLNPEKLMERYGEKTPRDLYVASEEMLRAFVRNYRLAPGLVPYVVGEYTILDSYELKGPDFFPSGVVVLAQSKDHPNVLLEHIFPADPKVVPVLHRMLLTGLDLQLSRGLDLSALLNVKRLDDGRIQFTAVPLVYGSYATTSGPGTFSLEPPKSLNISAGLPILGSVMVAEASQKFMAYRRRAGLEATTSPDGKPLVPQRSSPQLVRVQRPVAVNPEDEAPTPAPTPVPIAAADPQQTPAADNEVPAVSPTPSPTPAPSPPSIASTAGGAWPTYGPGQMPRGRLLGIPDMNELSSRGVGGERVYLGGTFVVTASGPNRAVLRAQGAIAENLGIKGKNSKVRVIAEFPTGSKPPSEGSSFSRDSMRPFQITDIRVGADGQVNVFVREVTRQ